MDVRILGPLEVMEDGQVVDLGVRQTRILFAVLALQAGAPVRSAQLAETLWPGGPPAKWEATVQSHVSRLRRALEPDRPPRAPSARLPTQGDAYLLTLAADELDAHRFEHLASEGRSALARGEPEKAHAIFTRALGEWRGPVLADFRDPELLSPDVGRLGELRLLAIEERAEASLALGNHREAIATLEALVVESPLRERCWELLLLALYRSGRQSEALRRYQEVRELLVEELGIEPGPALCALEGAILRQDDSLAPHVATPAPTRVEDLPLPTWLQSPGDEFVGRGAEMDALLASFASVCRGERRLALVVGEPGLGKTRLVREASLKLRDEGVLVVGGRCVEEPLHMLQPFAEAVERLVLTQADRLARESPGDAAALASLVPGLATAAAPPPIVDAETHRYHLFRAVSDLLDSRTAGQPVVLVLDDLHWIPTVSLKLLAHLLTDEERGPLLVLATARDTEPNEEVAKLMADLHRKRRLDKVPLPGLDPAEVAALAAARGADETWSNLYAPAQGNPFYVEELVRHIAESGGVPDSDALPESVRETIARRLLRLPPDSRKLLGIAAVGGAEFRLDVVTHAAGLEIEAADDALALALTAGIVAERPDRAGVYAFSHMLVQKVLRDGLGAGRRARVHRRYGEALAALGGSEREVARQLLAASADDSDVMPGIEAALAAADRAVDRYEYDDAADLLGTALDTLRTHAGADLRLVCRVSIVLAEALRRAGQYDQRMPLLEDAWGRATACADTELQAWVVIEGCAGTVNPAEPWITRASEVIPQLSESSARRIVLSAILAYHRSGEPGQESRDMAEWALARSAPLPPLERRLVLECCVLALVAWSPVERLLDLTRMELDAARASGSPFEVIEALSLTRFARLSAGDLAGWDETGQEYEEMVDTVHIPRFAAGVVQRRAMRALLSGRFVDAEAHAGTAVSLQPLPEFVEGYAVQLFAVRFEQGRLEEFRPTVEAWAGQDLRPAWSIGYSTLLAEVGELEAAQEVLTPYAATGFASVPRDEIYFLCLAAAAATVTHTHDRDSARVLYDLLAPHASRVVVAAQGALCWGSVHRFLGPLAALLGDGERASMHFEAAISVHERLGARPFLARDRLAYADLLRRADGDPYRIDELSRTGLALARELGMRIVLERYGSQVGRPLPS
ncbi:MAG: AAA family ATPase [Acidimicrobiia bacterium]|nr:AAA family ATPase [Acidimicrobiia bacterium]